MMNTKVDPCQDFYRYVYCSCLLLYITCPQLNHFSRNCDSDWKWCVYKITNKKNCKHLCRSSNFVAYRVPTLHMKGWWESNINVWFPFMYSQKWNCYFQYRIIMFCPPVPIYSTHISVCLFCSREICGLILGIYKSLTNTWMLNVELGLRKGIHKRDFPCSTRIKSLKHTVFYTVLYGLWQIYLGIHLRT